MDHHECAVAAVDKEQGGGRFRLAPPPVSQWRFDRSLPALLRDSAVTVSACFRTAQCTGASGGAYAAHARPLFFIYRILTDATIPDAASLADPSLLIGACVGSSAFIDPTFVLNSHPSCSCLGDNEPLTSGQATKPFLH
jgi:hypothetical protein